MFEIFDPKDTEFSLASFKSPAEEFSPVYGWFWNGPVTDAETEKQLLEMNRLGIRAFCIICEPKDFRPNTIPTLTDPNYLTDAYFERYKYAVKRAKELGMKCWLYDEGGWPSGGACGLVMYDHPEYARRTLGKRSFILEKGTPYKRTDADVFAAFINGSFMINEGDLFDTDTEVSEYYSERIAFKEAGKPDVPDVTRKESTDYFIKITHERYKEFISQFFGNTVTAVFTDEPLAPPIPFRQELTEEYEKLYGESVLPYLPAIHGDVTPTGKALSAKIRWFDLASRAFTENFLMRCKRWANENGLAFTGHLDRDDEPRGSVYGKSFHLMRAMRAMDVPGIDVIWRQIFPDKNGKKYENRFFPRYASSAAAQIGAKFAMTESFGVYGNGLTFEDMRFIVGFQAIRGVTLFNPMKISYARRGIWLSGELPSFDESNACYSYLGHFNKYMERLSYVLTRGERVTKTALYYPINNFWAEVDADEAANEFDALGFKMEENGVDFDIIDDDVISASEDLKSGVISMGKARYNEIVMPHSAILTEKTRADLEAFSAGGGRILFSADEATKTVTLVGGDGKIIASERAMKNGKMICLFNGSNEKKDFVLTLPKIDSPKLNAYKIDITAANVLNLKVTDTVRISLESGECTAVCLTEESICAEEIFAPEKEILIDDFEMRRTKSLTFGEMLLESEEIKEEPKKVSLGNWEDTVGKDFSGTCTYTARFAGIDSDAIIDLGDVRHSCEAFLNGEPLGVKIMKPFTFKIKREQMKKDNLLEIQVTNTMGNQQHFTKSFDKWGEWQLTPYNQRQYEFDKDSLDSGLYGPVKILY